MKEFWNERYSEDGFAYGTNPNDFLATHVNKLKEAGKVLCLAEGEGRNALFLARKGFQVTAVDFSEVGIQKIKENAQKEGLKIEAVVADLKDFDMGEDQWDGIISIFAHLPPPLRKIVHSKIQRALRPKGILILEAYTPKQLNFQTGGPKDEAMLVNLNILQEELSELTPVFETETEREIHEGKYHNGPSAVVQFIAER